VHVAPTPEPEQVTPPPTAPGAPKPKSQNAKAKGSVRAWLILSATVGFVILYAWAFNYVVSHTPSRIAHSSSTSTSPVTTPTPTPASSNDSLASAALNRGNQAFYAGNYQKAITDYTEAIRLKPDDSAGYRSRANCYEKLGKYSDAADDLAAAKRLTK
jgi:tetratricopeptide (TPR) repeat protein